MQPTAGEARFQIERQKNALDTLFSACPALAQHCARLGQQLANYSVHHLVELKDIEFGTTTWDNEGNVRFKVRHKKRILAPKEARL